MQTSEHTARREQRLGTPPRGRVESAQRASQRLRGAGVRQATSPGRRAALRLTPSAPLPGPTSCLDGAAADPFPRRLGAGDLRHNSSAPGHKRNGRCHDSGLAAIQMSPGSSYQRRAPVS
ncbi:unnamed protein product [Prorocentrum cordatum]|uniref:Uncharacterized protein n=1 Tax=Prorocentrum cordatum TaxID=2364126 RepID=A0ABN9WMQ2_9DINO|nr:unnamed protein product [Polarella glacialis]